MVYLLNHNDKDFLILLISKFSMKDNLEDWKEHNTDIWQFADVLFAINIYNYLVPMYTECVQGSANIGQ